MSKALSLALLGTGFAAALAFAGPSYPSTGAPASKPAAKELPSCHGQQDAAHNHNHQQKPKQAGCSMHEAPKTSCCGSQAK